MEEIFANLECISEYLLEGIDSYDSINDGF